MFNINNVAGTGKPYAFNQNTAPAPKTETEKDAKQKGPVTGRIMCAAPAAEKPGELSEAAQNYLADLKEKYGDYDFIIADYETDEEAQKLLSKGKGEMNVLITPDLLEKMAADETERAKYESIIDGAAEQFDSIKEKLGENASSVKRLGFSVKADGTVDYYALLTEGLKTDDGKKTVTAGFADELAEKITAIAEKRKAEKEEKEEQEEKTSTLPPKSFEKYRKEEDPYATEEDFGTLPPESFKKYEKEESPYSKEEDYGTLPPKSFRKYLTEEETDNTEPVSFTV